MKTLIALLALALLAGCSVLQPMAAGVGRNASAFSREPGPVYCYSQVSGGTVATVCR